MAYSDVSRDRASFTHVSYTNRVCAGVAAGWRLAQPGGLTATQALLKLLGSDPRLGAKGVQPAVMLALTGTATNPARTAASRGHQRSGRD
jgi:hypothetical protein